MVGALTMVGSSVVDSHTSPCLCLDSLPTSTMNHKSSGAGDNLFFYRNSMAAKRHHHHHHHHLSVELSSSFVDSWQEWRLSGKAFSASVYKSSKKQQRSKSRRLMIVSELAGQYEDSFEDVKMQILNYFTYKAVRTVMSQLYEMNPTQYRWFYDFVATNKPGDGKRFLRTLVKERQDLAERVMVTRLHLYGKWVKKCDHAQMYKEISDENLELMRERLMETVIWPTDDTNTEKIG